jgi:uncharacterized delta-60 repeat protein
MHTSLSHSLCKIAAFTLHLVCIALLLLTGARGQIGGLDPGLAVGAILNNSLPGEIRALTVRPDNSVIIAGTFTSVGGVERGKIAKVTSSGALDDSFAAGAGADGPINAIAVQTDGKIVVAGEFQKYDGIARGRIARLNPDGSLDSSFNSALGANGPIYTLAVSGSNIYAGGDFTTYNGPTCKRLVKLNNTGGSDPNFNVGTGPNAAVRCLAVSTFNLMVGGAFTSWGTKTRNRLASIDSFSGSLDSFYSDGGPDGPVNAIFLVTGSWMIIGGEFTHVSGVPRARLAAISRLGSTNLEPTFSFSADGPVRVLLDGGFSSSSDVHYVYVGGEFSRIDETPRGRFVRLKTVVAGLSNGLLNYGFDSAFHTGTGADAPVLAMGAQSDGRVILAGQFQAINGVSTPPAVRLYGDAGNTPPSSPTGATATAASATDIFLAWSGSVNASAYRIERSPNGLAPWTPLPPSSSPYVDSGLAPGTAYSYRVVAINYNGESAPSNTATATTLSTQWTGAGALDPASAAGAGTDGVVSAVAIQPDGGILLAGNFSKVHGVPRKNIARLKSDWTVDATFDPGIGPDGPVNAVALYNDRIVLVGGFANVAGSPRNKVSRLLANGTLDSSFQPPAGQISSLSAVAVQPDGRVIIGGFFEGVGEGIQQNLARLNADGSFDPSFTVSVGSPVSAVASQKGGGLLIGGSFFDVNGHERYGIARLKSDGSYDVSFNAGLGAPVVDAIALLNNGQIMISGFFTSVNNNANARNIARLNENGTVDTSFSSAAFASSFGGIECMAQQPDGKVVVGGSFTQVGGTTQFRLTRLNLDGSVDPSFRPGTGADGTVNALAIGPDTGIVLGGLFNKVGGVAQRGIARLLGDGNAAPPPTSTVTTSAIDSAQLRISWIDVAGEYEWKLERSPDGTTGWTEVAVLPWDVTDFTDRGLMPNTTYYYRLRAANSAGPSPYSLTASGKTRTLFDQWKLDLAIPLNTPDNADDDGDGVGLILEYALALDPSTVSVEGLPVGQVLGGYVALSYRRLHPDLLYAVESSTDLINWTTAGVSQGLGPFPIAFTFMGDGPQKFLRLRITQP